VELSIHLLKRISFFYAIAFVEYFSTVGIRKLNIRSFYDLDSPPHFSMYLIFLIYMLISHIFIIN